MPTDPVQTPLPPKKIPDSYKVEEGSYGNREKLSEFQEKFHWQLGIMHAEMLQSFIETFQVILAGTLTGVQVDIRCKVLVAFLGDFPGTLTEVQVDIR